MELKQLQSFCAVVQYRSFTKAAEKLYLSQPTVSTHIRQLEEEFGSRLIVRTTKSIEVTPRGQELYACACGIVHLRDDLLRSWSDEDEKVIRIGASTIPSAYILPQILPAFRREHPAPQFHVFQSDSEGIAEGLLTGSFDVGLIGARIHEEALELTRPAVGGAGCHRGGHLPRADAPAGEGQRQQEVYQRLLPADGGGGEPADHYGAAQRSGVHQESGGRRAGGVHHLGEGGGGRP